MYEFKQTLRDIILALARRYDFEEGHSFQDERLALRLFDETERLGLHSLSSSESPQGTWYASPCADILSFAAILHDIGYVEGYEQHHKTAFRLIMAEPIPGLSPREQTLVAHVARYHRGGIPDPAKHPAFAALPSLIGRWWSNSARSSVSPMGWTAATRTQCRTCAARLDGDRLIVTLLPGSTDEAERWAGQKKARWFEAVFGVQMILW